jgi:DNA-binding XRE family transcriptional regulator
MKEATFEDAKELAQKLNLNKESVWKIIKGKRYSTLTELAMAVQAAFAVHDPAHR